MGINIERRALGRVDDGTGSAERDNACWGVCACQGLVERASGRRRSPIENKDTVIQLIGLSEVRVLAYATGQMAGLEILFLDVCVSRGARNRTCNRSQKTPVNTPKIPRGVHKTSF
jgi:hypothetical protein